MEIGEKWDMLMKKLKVLKHSSNQERKKSDKWAKTIQVLQKDLKLVKSAIKSVDNSTCLHWYSFKTNTGKLQGVKTDYDGYSLNKFKVSII